MTAAPALAMPASGAVSYPFSDDDFAVIARRARADFGLYLTQAKKDLVYSRLTKRLRHLGLADFGTYCRLIESPAGSEERMAMLSALTTNVTHFFREEHHFTALRDTILPPLIAAARSGGRLRLWSAGCSAGQEPYSLALTILQLCPDAARYDIRILASDVDPAILARARDGIYDMDEIKSLPERLRQQHVVDLGGNRARIGEAPRALISFGELNLMEDWPMKGPFDIIFCRNVAIYFDKDTQSRLWQRFAGLLTPGGTLCIGHSERLAGPALSQFETSGVTSYRKHRPGAPSSSRNSNEGNSP